MISLLVRNGRPDGRTNRRTDRQICYIDIARQYSDASYKLKNTRMVWLFDGDKNLNVARLFVSIESINVTDR